MQLTHRFSVPADVETAWTTFNDLEDIAPCFPGAELTDYDGTHLQGLVRVKLGPISMQYAGSGEFVSRDESAHKAVIEAKGRDKRGNGTAAATVTLELTEAGSDKTDIEVLTDLNVTGKPAQFGRGVMQDVSDKLLGQFVACLEQKFAGGGTPMGGRHAAASSSSDSSAGSASSSEPSAGQSSGAASQEAADTPIARAAAAAAAGRQPEWKADDAGTAAPGETAPPGEQAEAPRDRGTSSSSGGGSGSPAAALDLGSTVLPIVAKRYAPFAVGAGVLFFVLKKLFGGSKGADVVIEVQD